MSAPTWGCRCHTAHITTFRVHLLYFQFFHVLFQTKVFDLIGAPLAILSSHLSAWFWLLISALGWSLFPKIRLFFWLVGYLRNNLAYSATYSLDLMPPLWLGLVLEFQLNKKGWLARRLCLTILKNHETMQTKQMSQYLNKSLNYPTVFCVSLKKSKSMFQTHRVYTHTHTHTHSFFFSLFPSPKLKDMHTHKCTLPYLHMHTPT